MGIFDRNYKRFLIKKFNFKIAFIEVGNLLVDESKLPTSKQSQAEGSVLYFAEGELRCDDVRFKSNRE